MASKDLINQLKGFKASSDGGGNRFQQGRYRLVVTKLAFPTTKMAGDTFIAELSVKSTEATPGATLKDDVTPALPNPVGSTVSFALAPNANPKYKEQAAGDIRKFIEHLDGSVNMPDEDYGNTLFAMVNEDPKTGEVNPTRGFEILCEATARPEKIKTGKNVGEKFIQLRWTHVALTPEQVEANRKVLAGEAEQAA